jgi:hypothetical protein
LTRVRQETKTTQKHFTVYGFKENLEQFCSMHIEQNGSVSYVRSWQRSRVGPDEVKFLAVCHSIQLKVFFVLTIFSTWRRHRQFCNYYIIARHAARLLRISRNLWGEGHLIISIRVRRLVDTTQAVFTVLPFATTWSSIDPSLSIKPPTTINHVKSSSPAAWKEALIASGSAPESCEIIKTLVYKPKTAKTATPVPVVVIARDIGKKRNFIHLASEDLLIEFFALDKNPCTRIQPLVLLIYGFSCLIVSPFSLSESTFSKVVTVLNSSVVSSSSTFAVHDNSSAETHFLTGKDIESYR